MAVRKTATRVHLVVHRDPQSGNTRVGLNSPLFSEGWQNELAASAADTAHGAIAGALNESNVVALARHAMDVTSRLVAGLLARAAKGTVACKASCDHCCHQAVGVTPPEALAIVDYLKRTLSVDALADLTARLAEARKRTYGLSAAERHSPDLPCPFLEFRQCSIYQVRPLSCRGMNSLDAKECEKNLRDSNSRAAFLKSGVGSQCFVEPIRAFHAISAGIQLALSELFHLDMQPLDLTAAVHELLTGPDSITRDWLSGRAPLERTRAPSANDVQMRSASGALPGEHA